MEVDLESSSERSESTKLLQTSVQSLWMLLDEISPIFTTECKCGDVCKFRHVGASKSLFIFFIFFVSLEFSVEFSISISTSKDSNRFLQVLHELLKKLCVLRPLWWVVSMNFRREAHRCLYRSNFLCSDLSDEFLKSNFINKDLYRPIEPSTDRQIFHGCLKKICVLSSKLKILFCLLIN